MVCDPRVSGARNLWCRSAARCCQHGSPRALPGCLPGLHGFDIGGDQAAQRRDDAVRLSAGLGGRAVALECGPGRRDLDFEEFAGGVAEAAHGFYLGRARPKIEDGYLGADAEAETLAQYANIPRSIGAVISLRLA